MIIKEPQFWYNPSKRFMALPLLPFSLIFLLLGWLRGLFTVTKRVPCPVICVGNITVGGTGKTPTVLKIASILKSQGKTVHFLTRGYGGNLKGPVLVKPGFHTYEDVGDEALLLAEVAPTWVSTHRYEGAKAASQNGADVIVMDDGLQNPSLYKDLSFVVVDGSRGFGNGFVIPAGPLREPKLKGLTRADSVIMVGEGQSSYFNKPTLKASLRARETQLKKLRTGKYFAFCGIGNPSKFFETLKENRVNVVGTKTFPDHYKYGPKDMSNLLETSRNQKVKLITTKKDWVRLPTTVQNEVDVLDVEMTFQDELALESLLTKIERV